MGDLAETVGIAALVLAAILLFIGNMVALAGPTHGPNWMAAAIIAWVALALIALGVFACACATEIERGKR